MRRQRHCVFFRKTQAVVWNRKLNSRSYRRGMKSLTPLTPTTAVDQSALFEKQVARARRIFIFVAAGYGHEMLTLTGFWAAGYVTAQLLMIVVALVAAAMAVSGLLLYSGKGLSRADPGLFLPQQMFGMALCFGLILAAPQICIQPLATSIMMVAFGFLAPSRAASLLCWGAMVVGSAIVIALAGSRLALPTDTPAGRFLFWWVMLGTLTRCFWIVNFVRTLQDRIRDKRAALNAALAQIERLASIDDLTGLDNRRSLMQWLAAQMALHERTGQPLCVALLDVDHFKRVNDTFGHAAGDRVLQRFAREALSTLGSADRLGRYGGEEFILVLPATSLRESETPLERIRQGIADSDWSEINPRMRITVTIGATEYRSGETVEELLQRADAALYQGKGAGRNQVVIDPAPAERTIRLKRQA